MLRVSSISRSLQIDRVSETSTNVTEWPNDRAGHRALFFLLNFSEWNIVVRGTLLCKHVLRMCLGERVRICARVYGKEYTLSIIVGGRVQ